MLIVKGKYLLTKEGLKENYGLAIKKGTIAEIKLNDLLPPPAKTISCNEGIIVPEFINAHTHMYGTVAHSIHTTKEIKDFSDFLNIFW